MVRRNELGQRVPGQVAVIEKTLEGSKTLVSSVFANVRQFNLIVTPQDLLSNV